MGARPLWGPNRSDARVGARPCLQPVGCAPDHRDAPDHRGRARRLSAAPITATDAPARRPSRPRPPSLRERRQHVAGGEARPHRATVALTCLVQAPYERASTNCPTLVRDIPRRLSTGTGTRCKTCAKCLRKRLSGWVQFASSPQPKRGLDESVEVRHRLTPGDPLWMTLGRTVHMARTGLGTAIWKTWIPGIHRPYDDYYSIKNP